MVEIARREKDKVQKSLFYPSNLDFYFKIIKHSFFWVLYDVIFDVIA